MYVIVILKTTELWVMRSRLSSCKGTTAMILRNACSRVSTEKNEDMGVT